MATAQRPSAKPGATPQYESFVEQQLARARSRLRGLDLAVWVMGLGSVMVAYGLLESLADRLWHLPTGVRLAAWCCCAVAIAVGLGAGLTRLALQRVNPHYVARQLEQTVPDAKNSVINWLDLRGEPLAPVIRGSLGRRAAKDLAHADPELAISARPAWWLGGALAILLLLQLGWLIAAPGQVLSLLQRAFFPFDKSQIARRTELMLLQPQGGDIAVPANQPVHFRVEAQGYVPQLNQNDSLKLHFRYHPSEPFEVRGLVADVDGTWTTVVHPDQVRNGFWYKITGGDARLPEDREYRVVVRPIAQVLQFEATFKYRDYLRVKDKNVVYDKNVRPSIKELRGTETTLTVHANRVLKQCVLELTTAAAKKKLAGEPVLGDPEAWRFKWVLDHSGEFRILFESKDGEANVDRQPCTVEVIPDRAPEVVLTKPAKDLSLPANVTLVVAGRADDDFGVKSMQLCVKLLKAPTTAELRPKAYRPDAQFQLVNGKYPLGLDYSDYVALDSLQTTANQPFPLTAGMELEYWLEARDNCDYPDKNGNLGKSARYKLTIDPPATDKNKVAQDRQGAQQETQQNQSKQDDALGDQNMMAKAEKDASSGNGGQKQGDPQKQQDLQNQAKEVQKALDEANNKGSAKGAGEDTGDPKDKGTPEGATGKNSPKNNPPEKKDDPGKDKEQGKDGQGKAAEHDQDKGPDAGDQSKNAQGTGKDQGQPDASKQQPGAAKGKDGDPKAGAADSAKGEPKTAPKDGGPDAKGAQGADAKTGELSKEKGPGDQAGGTTSKAAPGDGKDAIATSKPAPKDAPTTLEQVRAKGGDPSNLPPPPDAKLGPAESSQMAGNAKTGDRKDATLDDVNKLREQLGDPALRELAQKALERISEEANDAKVGQAADKALDAAKGQPAPAKDSGPQTRTSASKGSDNTPTKSAGPADANPAAGKNTQPKADATASKEGDGTGKTGPTAKSDPSRPGAGNFGTEHQGTVGQDEPANANPIDEAAARRAGELQLESLKKQIDKLRDKLTPEVLKKLNWTEKEREQFLRKMLADALLRQQQQNIAGEKLPAPGSIQGLLPAAGPRSLQHDPRDKSGEVANDHPSAPPEVREALKLLQSK